MSSSLIGAGRPTVAAYATAANSSERNSTTATNWVEWVKKYACLPTDEVCNAAEDHLRVYDGDFSPLQGLVKNAAAALEMSHFHLDEYMKMESTGVNAAVYIFMARRKRHPNVQHPDVQYPLYAGMTIRKGGASERKRSFKTLRKVWNAILSIFGWEVTYVCFDASAAAKAAADTAAKAEAGGNLEKQRELADTYYEAYYNEIKGKLGKLEGMVLTDYDFAINTYKKTVKRARQANFLIEQMVAMASMAMPSMFAG